LSFPKEPVDSVVIISVGVRGQAGIGFTSGVLDCYEITAPDISGVVGSFQIIKEN